jgi:hypothetical protein
MGLHLHVHRTPLVRLVSSKVLMKLSIYTYLIGLLPGIAARQNPRLFKEPAGLWLVDGFRKITRAPLVRFWSNLAWTLDSCMSLWRTIATLRNSRIFNEASESNLSMVSQERFFEGPNLQSINTFFRDSFLPLIYGGSFWTHYIGHTL